jgi:large subunit ribosomal protein L13
LSKIGCEWQGFSVKFALFFECKKELTGKIKPTLELRMRTFSAKPESVQREWFVVDAEGKTLGRLATEIARRLRGKHKAEYTPHVDTGDYIVVVNAEKVAVTGKKEADKMYYRHTEFPGGIKGMTLGELREKAPERILQKAVKGMIPSNPLGRDCLRKLKIFVGPEHTHQAQQPKELNI